MTLILLPLVAPIVAGLAFDPVWFTVLFAVCLQTSFLTPPIGGALFYLRGVIDAEVVVPEPALAFNTTLFFTLLHALVTGSLEKIRTSIMWEKSVDRVGEKP